MKAVATVAMVGVATPAMAQASDPWWGPDKVLHFGATAALATGGYATGALLFEGELPRFALGAGLGLGAGVAKELWDLSGRGDPSWKDLTWDVVGTGTGLLASWVVDRFILRPLLRDTAGERVALVLFYEPAFGASARARPRR
jgi:putative lipoprotein